MWKALPFGSALTGRSHKTRLGRGNVNSLLGGLARVVPTGVGDVNAAGLDFYDRWVDELSSKGIAPLPTLYRWDLPYSLEQQGGWVARETAYAYADYAEAVVTRLGDRIAMWTTLNEPHVSGHHGYVDGEHALGRVSRADGFAAPHHVMLAHGLAGQRIRAHAPECAAGRPVRPRR